MSNNIKIENIKSDHYDMDYFSFGEGPRHFVMIPGLSLKPVSLSADFVSNNYALFHKGFTSTVFDRKKNAEEGYSISDMAADTADAMRRLGISNACLLGCSQGGMIATVLAAHHPELVEKVVLASTAHYTNDTMRNVVGRWVALAESGDVVNLNHDIFTNVYSASYYTKYHSAFELLEKQGTENELHQLAVMGKACLNFDLTKQIADVKCPVLVIGDTNDHVVSGKASVELAEALHCPLFMYNEYGHAAYDEAPDYKQRLLDFFGA